MPEHQRADSQAVIDALASLGQALGYAATPEWPIPADTHPPPAVDVVWLRRPEDSSPLFAFEVESFAKQGMSDNALKLMSRPSAELPKPLHFAQVILNGGQRSHRTADLARQFAAHNYDVYSLSGDGEEARLLRDVLNAHHRVRGEVDLFDFAEALRDCPWGDDVVDEALLHVELVGFDAAYTTDYAEAALTALEDEGVDVKGADWQKETVEVTAGGN